MLLLLVCNSIFAQAPTITSYYPNKVTTGSRVTITGTNFTGTTAANVKFGGTSASSVTVTSTQIVAVVAAGTSGNLTVTNNSATATASGIVFVTPAATSATAKITKAYSDYDGFWQTGSGIEPNNRHNLLGFTYNNVTYSTAVSNSTLNTNGVTFTPANFRAFPFNFIGGTTNSGSYIAFGSMIDGSLTSSIATAPGIAGKTVRDVLIDGKRGLDLGTGITNLPTNTILDIDIASVTYDAINDSKPDIVITQTAQPDSATDTYCFTDSNGNIIGNPISVSMSSSSIPTLANYRLDLFNLTSNASYPTAVPTTPWASSSPNDYRPIKMIAYQLSDFGINSTNYGSITKFHIFPSGSSDPAFIAYNNASFVMAGPEIITQPESQIACTGNSATFTVSATGANLTYQWFKNDVAISTNGTSATYTISNVSASSVAEYKVLVSNTYGAMYSDDVYINTLISTQPANVSTCQNVATTVSVTADGLNLSYQWYSNSTNSTTGGTLIPGATTTTYSPNVETAGDKYYYCIITNNGQACGGATTNVTKVTVTGTNALVSSANQSICTGSTPTVSITGYTSGTIQWLVSPDGTSWANVSGGSGATTTSYTAGAITATRYYRAKVTPTSNCGYALSPIITVTVGTYTWTGTTDKVWNKTTNWSCGAIPTLTNDVVIPVVASGNYPLIDNANGIAKCKNLTINANASVLVTGNGAGTLQIAGTITNNGTIDAVNGTIAMLGTSAQSIPANTFNTNVIRNLTINNTAGVTLNGTTALTGILTVTAGQFTTGNALTLKSNAATTAMIAPVGGSISGTMTIERYYPARRAYRFVSSSVDGGSINQNWQEGAPSTDPVGIGTDITGAGGTTNGFDVSGTNNPSLYTYDNVGAAWNAVTSTLSTNLAAGKAYRLFVRGDRTVDQTLNASTPTNTTLRANGTVKTGNVVVSDLSQTANAYNLVGNPYQAPVNMNLVLADATNVNPNYYYIWDPTLGGIPPATGLTGGRGAYTTVTLPSGANTGGSSNKYLQANQAVFVKTLANGPATLTFKESHKDLLTNTTPSVYKAAQSHASISMHLFDSNSLSLNDTPADGLLIEFDNSYSNDKDAMDAPKFTNSDENVAILNGTSKLSVERRAAPAATDVITLFNNQYRRTNYTYVVNANQLSGVNAFLVDQYTNTTTTLNNNEETIYNFEVNQDVAESINENRFKIVFEEAALGNTEIEKTNFTIYPNPASDQFTVAIATTDTATVTLFNQLGQTISCKIQSSANLITVTPDSHLEAGIYMVQVSSNGKNMTKKLIIK
jgi:hypothetical protein